MSFDIRKIAIGATGKMPVRDVEGNPVFDDEGNPLTITFYGPGSLVWVRAKAETQNEVMEEMQAEAEAAKEAEKNKKKGGKPEPKPEIDLEAAHRRTAKLLARVTVSLDNFDYPGGPEALFNDPAFGHITEDANSWVVKRGNFKQSSASSSASTSDTQPG